MCVLFIFSFQQSLYQLSFIKVLDPEILHLVRLLGITEDNGKEGICSENGEKVFGVGHRTESHTMETSWIVGHYLGDPKNPCKCLTV